MVDLGIIGGGMWGRVLAIKAEDDYGISTVMFDDPESLVCASRAATGMVCLDWYKQDTVAKMLPDFVNMKLLDEALAWLEEYLDLTQTGEMFSGYHREDWIRRSDCYLVPDMDVLFQLYAAKHCKASAFDDLKASVKVSTGDTIVECRRLVVAAGVHTDVILQASGYQPLGVRRLFGRGVYYDQGGEPPFDTPHTFMIAPYKHITIRQVPGSRIRLGDTVEKTDSKESRDKWDFMLDVVLNTFAPKHGDKIEERAGYRPVLDKMVCEKISKNVVVATGGHRVGLGLAPIIADRAIGLLF